MKKLSIISMIVGCLTAMCLTSCNDSDAPKVLTPEEVQSAFMTVKGDYTGDLVYEKKTDKDVTPVKPELDTLKISWQIDTDSTLTIKAFPTKLLAERITDKALSEALAAQADVDLKCYIGFYSLNPVAFIINPVAPSYNVNYDDKEHKVQVAFYVNSSFSYGAYNSNKKQIQMQIVEAAIYVDGKYDKKLLEKGVPFVLSAKK